MEVIDINKMELGNLLFGNSRGNFHMPREGWQHDFVEFLYDCGFDGYGYYLLDESAEYFENDVFIVRPYYWGEDEQIAELPNFVYKPTNITISWYKYPLRDSYISHNISQEELRAVLNACRQSVGVNAVDYEEVSDEVE